MIDKDMIIQEPDKSELRKFSFMMGLMIAAVFGLLLPWLFGTLIPYWPWIISAVFIVAGIVTPAAMKMVYILWMRFGLLMSRIMNPLILGLIFFVVFFPVACFMRLIKRDPLFRKLDYKTETYRIPRRFLKKESMENPF